MTSPTPCKQPIHINGNHIASCIVAAGIEHDHEMNAHAIAGKASFVKV
jgi:hypothetical protein